MPINFIPNLDSTLLLDEILTHEGEKKGTWFNAIAWWDTGLVWMRARILALEENLFRMKDWMKSICKFFLGMGVTFRDESNEAFDRAIKEWLL